MLLVAGFATVSQIVNHCQVPYCIINLVQLSQQIWCHKITS